MAKHHFILLLLALTSGCGRSSAVPAVIVRDSAGVQLVEYSADPWTGGPRLKLSRVFRIGWKSDEPTFQAEVWPTPGQLRLDGSVAIGDYRGNQVYLLSSDGHQIELVGNEGSGPGEYREIAAVLTVHDTVVVQDDGNRRLTRFAQQQSATQPMPPSRCHMVAASGPRGYVAIPYCQSGDVTPGWGEAAVEIWDRGGAPVDTLSRVPYFYASQFGDANPILQHASLAGLPDGGFVYARTDVPAISWHSGTGAVRQIVRWPPAPNEASSDDWEEYEQWYKNRVYREQSPAVVARQLQEQKKNFHGPMPLFRAVYTADDGSVLLSSFTWDAMPAYADLFAPDGRYAGRVQLPERFVPIDINGDHIVGWEFDSSDVPALGLYRIANRRPDDGT